MSRIGAFVATSRRTTTHRGDPSLNTDARTMSPLIYGEVFVLDDGGEAQKAHEAILRMLNLSGVAGEPALGEWLSKTELCTRSHEPVRIAMVGKYTGLQDSYLSVLKLPEI